MNERNSLPRPTGRPSVGELRDVAVAAVRAAGAVLVDGLAKPKDVERKNERTSIVTWVDRAAQAEALGVITGRFPDHAVLAEEDDGAAAGGAEYTWLVDPLDGTSNYAHGIPFACSSVAVRDGAGPVAGAVLEPFRGELFTASRGGGAWLGEQRLHVSLTDRLDRALVGTGVQTDDGQAIAAFGRRIVALLTHCRAVRSVGSPALSLAYVAAGRIDAFLERDGTYAWDLAAGALMITEAGGRIEDLGGGPINLGPGIANVLATNGRIHDALADLVRGSE
jgi:myo-inositol-1(or 4)-monophosphatase